MWRSEYSLQHAGVGLLLPPGKPRDYRRLPGLMSSKNPYQLSHFTGPEMIVSKLKMNICELIYIWHFFWSHICMCLGNVRIKELLSREISLRMTLPKPN